MYTNQASSSVAHPCMNKNAPRQVGKGQSEEKQHPIPHAHLRTRRAGKKRREKKKKTIIAWAGRRGKLRNLLFGRFVRLACC